MRRLLTLAASFVCAAVLGYAGALALGKKYLYRHAFESWASEDWGEA